MGREQRKGTGEAVESREKGEVRWERAEKSAEGDSMDES
jgi:hypothetical protein